MNAMEIITKSFYKGSRLIFYKGHGGLAYFRHFFHGLAYSRVSRLVPALFVGARRGSAGLRSCADLVTIHDFSDKLLAHHLSGPLATGILVRNDLMLALRSANMNSAMFSAEKKKGLASGALHFGKRAPRIAFLGGFSFFPRTRNKLPFVVQGFLGFFQNLS